MTFKTERQNDSETERRQYEESKKEYWDYYSTMQTAHNKGIEKARHWDAQKEEPKALTKPSAKRR